MLAPMLARFAPLMPRQLPRLLPGAASRGSATPGWLAQRLPAGALAPARLFPAATLGPALLVALGALFGGIFAWAAALAGTGIVLLLDRLAFAAADPDRPEAEFPGSDRLLLALGAAHFLLLPLGLAALAGWTGLGLGERLLVFVALAHWLGQVSNANAHELIHRAARLPRRLGTAIYGSMLFGHHVSAHRLVHHRWVGSEHDPNTAELGESFYEFWPRAWAGSYAAGREMESARLRQAGQPRWRHPYLGYAAISLAMLLIVAALFGFAGVIGWLLLSAAAQAQLLLSDYVQHYGLERHEVEMNRLEPVAPWHSWNAPHAVSGAMMLNAARHSDHHAHPSRSYPELSLPDRAPVLPRALPVMAALALVPPAWFRVMDKRALEWRRPRPAPQTPTPRRAA